MSGIGVILLAVAAVLFLLPRKDQQVKWTWEPGVLERVLGKQRKVILCSRHSTARAQGRIVGCEIAGSAVGLCRYASKVSAVVGGEILCETGYSVPSILKMQVLAAGLHSTLKAINRSASVKHLRRMGAGEDVGVGEAAAAVSRELLLAQKLVYRKAVRRLKELADTPVAPPADVATAYKEIGLYLTGRFPRRLDDIRQAAAELQDIVKVKWDEDREATSAEPSCTPEFTSPVAADRAV